MPYRVRVERIPRDVMVVGAAQFELSGEMCVSYESLRRGDEQYIESIFPPEPLSGKDPVVNKWRVGVLCNN